MSTMTDILSHSTISEKMLSNKGSERKFQEFIYFYKKYRHKKRENSSIRFAK